LISCWIWFKVSTATSDDVSAKFRIAKAQTNMPSLFFHRIELGLKLLKVVQQFMESFLKAPSRANNPTKHSPMAGKTSKESTIRATQHIST